MSLALVLVLLVAAAVHAAWNLLLKRVPERQVIVWWALIVSTFVMLPLALSRPGLNQAGWRLALLSGLLEVLYYTILMLAYGLGEFSLVYPIARGAAPVLLALWTALFLGEVPRPLGMAGIGLIVTGLVTVGSAGWRSASGGAVPRRSGFAPGMGLALLVALLISIYSTLDGAAVKTNDPAVYSATIYALTAAILAPVLFRRHGILGVAAVWKTYWKRAVAVGVLQSFGYLLVLAVYARARVSYAGAIRESSVVLGALAGWLWLGEEFGPRRVIGAVVIFLGVLTIALAR